MAWGGGGVDIQCKGPEVGSSKLYGICFEWDVQSLVMISKQRRDKYVSGPDLK